MWYFHTYVTCPGIQTCSTVCDHKRSNLSRGLQRLVQLRHAVVWWYQSALRTFGHQWNHLEVLFYAALVWKKTAPNKSFRACTCTKLHNNHEGNLHHIPRKYWLKCMWLFPCCDFPLSIMQVLFRNELLESLEPSTMGSIGFYWQFVVCPCYFSRLMSSL